MARAITDGSGVLVCLTHEGDCHGKEESKEEIREKEEVTKTQSREDWSRRRPLARRPQEA
jgi:hypothetical protein